MEKFVVRTSESHNSLNLVKFTGGKDFRDTLLDAIKFAEKQVRELRTDEGWARVDLADGTGYGLHTSYA